MIGSGCSRGRLGGALLTNAWMAADASPPGASVDARFCASPPQWGNTKASYWTGDGAPHTSRRTVQAIEHQSDLIKAVDKLGLADKVARIPAQVQEQIGDLWLGVSQL